VLAHNPESKISEFSYIKVYFVLAVFAVLAKSFGQNHNSSDYVRNGCLQTVLGKMRTTGNKIVFYNAMQ